MDFDKIPECDVIDNQVLHRLRMGLQTNILITGTRGSGKSSFGCRMGERLAEKINNGKGFMESDIIDSFLKFLMRLDKIDRPGEIIMVEEVSVLFPSKRAMSDSNVSLGKILDVIRKKQVIMISNAPLWPSVDSHMRAMTDILIECKGVLRQKGVVIAKAWRVQTNTQTGKTYRHTLRRNGRRVRLFYSKKFNQDIWDRYEKSKDEFIKTLIFKLIRKAEVGMKKERKELGLIHEDDLSDAQKRIVKFWKQGIFKQKDIAEKLNINQRSVNETVSLLKKKGFHVDNYKKQ